MRVEVLSAAVVCTWIVLALCLVLLATTMKSVAKLQSLLQKPVLLSVGSRAPYFIAQSPDTSRVTLNNYLGTETVFVFIDFQCVVCRQELPEITAFHAGRKTQFVIVTEQFTTIIASVVNELVQNKLPVIIAPRLTNDFVRNYNPHGLSPYFCMVDANGLIAASGYIGKEEWKKNKLRWQAESFVG